MRKVGRTFTKCITVFSSTKWWFLKKWLECKAIFTRDKIVDLLQRTLERSSAVLERISVCDNSCIYRFLAICENFCFCLFVLVTGPNNRPYWHTNSSASTGNAYLASRLLVTRSTSMWWHQFMRVIWLAMGSVSRGIIWCFIGCVCRTHFAHCRCDNIDSLILVVSFS